MHPYRPTRMEPNTALAEMLARDGVLDDILSGVGLRFERAEVIEVPTVLPPGVQPFRGVPPPDWERERLEALARDRAARVAEAAALLESAEPPSKPTTPAPPARKRGWRKEAA